MVRDFLDIRGIQRISMTFRLCTSYVLLYDPPNLLALIHVNHRSFKIHASRYCWGKDHGVHIKY